MSDFINQIYDEMDLKEVICRLPGDMAVAAIERRIQTPTDLVEFFQAAAVEKETSKCVPVKNHINSIVEAHDNIADVLNAVDSHWHPVLHGYLNDTNKDRFLTEGADVLSVKFQFNLTKSDDIAGLSRVLTRIISDTEPSYSQVLSVLNKVVPEHFQTLAKLCLKSDKPIVKASILAVYNEYNYETISDHQKMIALKAFAKIPSSHEGLQSCQPVDFQLFKDMKPLERLLALDRYLSLFPVYQKRKAFDPAPSEEEFEDILFAGCFQYYDLVESITNKYKAITEEESP